MSISYVLGFIIFSSTTGTRLLTKGAGFVACSTFKKNTGLQDTQLFVDFHIPIKSTSIFSKVSSLDVLILKIETGHT